MWLEYIRYRFRLDKADDLLELTQLAALKALRNSPRCRSWRVLPAADDPSLLVLEIEWLPGAELTPFRGSDEFSMIHSALAAQTRSLEEADYSVDAGLLRRLLGGPEALFRLAEDIVAGVINDPLLAWRFQSEDGSKRGRLGLWLLEVLGGPDLFSSSFPGSNTREGPLASGRLDLEERERLLEIALESLPEPHEEQQRCVVGNLRAHLPVHPAPPSRLLAGRLLPPGTPAPASGVLPALESEAGASSPVSTAQPAVLAVAPGVPSPAASAPASVLGLDLDVELDEPRAADDETPLLSRDGEPRLQTGVRPRLDEAAAAEADAQPWPARFRPLSAMLRSRASGKWPRWRVRTR